MENIKVSLHKEKAHTLERNVEGQWLLDGKVIEQEHAIRELVEAVQDLGYWCQVAKDVLPTEQFEIVQEAYEYHEEDDVLLYTIVLNGVEKEVGGDELTYEQIVELAVKSKGVYTVIYSRGANKEKGYLVKGQKVTLSQYMRINCDSTNNA